MERHASDNYRRLGLMTLLHFAAMYALMYAMVDSFAEALPNTNQLYMAALMTAPMLLIEMTLMRGMYRSAPANAAIVVLGALLLVGAFTLIRQQTAIGDRQFLRSMIPHHSGAILMCRESEISDRRVRELCGRIVESQRQEILEMEAILRSM